MLRTLLLLSTVRYPVFTIKRFSSSISSPSMSASSIVLPHDEIENLWFGGLNLEPGKPPAMDVMKRWFTTDETFDISCRKYEPLVSQLVKLPYDDLVALGSTPRESLTLLLLLDQLARNYARGTSLPFKKCDPITSKLAEHFVSQRHDKQHPPWKQFWYYLPFGHAESLAYQDLGLAKFAEACWELRKGEGNAYLGLMREGMEFAWRHYVVIKRFGRFPHRNRVLGRESTEEERKYLEDGGETFSF